MVFRRCPSPEKLQAIAAARDAAAIAQHLAKCERCRSAFEAYCANEETLGALRTVSNDADGLTERQRALLLQRCRELVDSNSAAPDAATREE